MPIELHILPPQNLVLLRFRGLVVDEDVAEALEIYATHPEAAPGQNVLSDMSELTEGRIDINKRLSLQSSLDRILSTGAQARKLVYLAPGDTAQRLARQYAHFWETSNVVATTIVGSEVAAFATLGLPCKSVDGLLEGCETLTQ